MKLCKHYLAALVLGWAFIVSSASAIEFGSSISTGTTHSESWGSAEISGTVTTASSANISGIEYDYDLRTPCGSDCSSSDLDLVSRGDYQSSSVVVNQLDVLQQTRGTSDSEFCNLSVDLGTVSMSVGASDTESSSTANTWDTSTIHTTGQTAYNGTVYEKGSYGSGSAVGSISETTSTNQLVKLDNYSTAFTEQDTFSTSLSFK